MFSLLRHDGPSNLESSRIGIPAPRLVITGQIKFTRTAVNLQLLRIQKVVISVRGDHSYSDGVHDFIVDEWLVAHSGRLKLRPYAACANLSYGG